jgi:mannose-6-phosphate isomerase-like protein (cupin superfamily)
MSYNLKKSVKSVDERGSLIAFNSLDFSKTKRCFFINCKKDAWRGRHYHKKTSQIICVVGGTLEAKVHDGNKSTTLFLNEGDVFRQEPGVQFEFKSLTNESQIVVLSDTEHDPEDYYSY